MVIPKSFVYLCSHTNFLVFDFVPLLACEGVTGAFLNPHYFGVLDTHNFGYDKK